MAAGDIRAGGAYVEITAEDSKLQGALRDAESATQKFQRKLDAWSVGVGAALTAAFIGAKKALDGLFGSLSNYGDKLDEMSQRIGISVESLARLDKMAMLCGSTIEEFESAITRMQRSLEQAAQGGAQQTAALQRLGLSISSLKSLSPEQQFLTVAKAMGDVSDQAERVALTMTLFGRTGTTLLPFFNEGAEGIQNLEDRISSLGGVISSDAAAAFGELNDSLDILKSTMTTTAASMLSTMVPAVKKALDLIESTWAWVRKLHESHRAVGVFVGTVSAASAAFLACAGAMTVWSLAAGKLSAALKLVSSALALATTNPWTLGLIAAAAAVGGLVAWLQKGKAAIKDYTSEVEAVTRQHEEQAATDRNLMARLEELANKTNKSAEEMAEAELIVSRLSSRYGDLGISINKATGEIEGMTEAQQRLATAQKNIKIADLKAEVAALSAQATRSDREGHIAEMQSDLSNLRLHTDKGHNELYGTNRRYTRTYDKLQEKLAERKADQESLAARQEYLAALEQGVDLKVSEQGARGEVAPETDVPDVSSARARAERAQAQASRIGVSDYDLAIRDAQAAFDETKTAAEQVRAADIAGGMAESEAEERFRATMDAAQKIMDAATTEAAERKAAQEDAQAEKDARLAAEKEAAAEREREAVVRAAKEREREQEEENRRIADAQKRHQEYAEAQSAILAQNISDGIRESASVRGTFSAFEGTTESPLQEKMLKASEQSAKFIQKVYQELYDLNQKYEVGYTA